MGANNAALNVYEIGNAKADGEWANFENSSAHKAMIEWKTDSLLSDFETLRGGLNLDDIKYGFNTNPLRMDEAQREATREAMTTFENELAATIKGYIETDNYEALGHLMAMELKRLIDKKVEDFVDDNWRAWA